MKLSVIIGRFQTPYLHQGHLKLIEEAKRKSEAILILIGCTAATGTDKNPLDFKTRERLFYETGLLSSPVILPLDDMPSDKDWSDKVDKIIDDLGFKEAVIFGGRDSSIEGYYSGKHEIKIIDDHGNHSATSLRKEIGEKLPMQCPNFRSGVIHHVENRYPIVYHTVDVIVLHKGEGDTVAKVLMGKKGDKFHFIGGFVDPEDKDLESAAIRELAEETGIEQTHLHHAKSMKIDDSRYRNTKDSIMTHIFMAISGFEERKIQYDKIKDREFKEFKYIPIEITSMSIIADCHLVIFKYLLTLT